MIPKEFFAKSNVTVDNGTVCAIMPQSKKGVYEDCIRKAADTLKFRCDSILSLGEKRKVDDVWEKIGRAELIISDFSNGDPITVFQTAVALSQKDKDSVCIICDKDLDRAFKSIFKGVSIIRYNTESLEDLRDQVSKVIQSVDRKRSGTIDIPNFKSIESEGILENAIKASRKEDWSTAQILFKNVSEKEEGHWYVMMKWGIMYREKQDWARAEKKFQEAEEVARYDDHKASVYIERAIMYQKSDKIDEADSWFAKAQKADSNNTRLYFAWAKFWDEKGKANRALEKMLYIINNIDTKNEAAKNKLEYFSKKVQDTEYSLTYSQFINKKKAAYRGSELPIRPDRPLRSYFNISTCTREELLKIGAGKKVTGIVRNLPDYGVIVNLSRDYHGLIHEKNLAENWSRKFFKGQRVKVKISRVYEEGKKIKIQLEQV